nr:hypothetical protein [uncultured Prevotella sp.]
MLRNYHNELFMSSLPDILMVSTLCVDGQHYRCGALAPMVRSIRQTSKDGRYASNLK